MLVIKMDGIDTKIENIDTQGEPEKVLTDYRVNTISLVGVNALGVNVLKVKSKDDSEGDTALMSRIKKAKALDAEANEKGGSEPVVSAEEGLEHENPEQVPNESQAGEEPSSEPVVDPEGEDGSKGEEPNNDEPEQTQEENPEPEAKTEPEPENVPDEPEAKSEPVAEPEPENSLDVDPEGEAGNKAKAFTVDDVVEARKIALTGVSDVVKRIMDSVPDADTWQVFDLVNSAVWQVEDAVWHAESSLWDQVEAEVRKEVQERVHKAKSLKVAAEGDLETKIKALEQLDPTLAAALGAELRESHKKSLKLEEEAKEASRKKALEEGEKAYSRMACDDNSITQIVDALLLVQESNPTAHTALKKALDQASNIIEGGTLFPDMGSSSMLQAETKGEYLERKAKALVEENGGELAAARAAIRQTDEFKKLYAN